MQARKKKWKRKGRERKGKGDEKKREVERKPCGKTGVRPIVGAPLGNSLGR